MLSDIENERGEQYHLDYYANGLIQQETGFDGRRTTYEYDLNGQLLKKTELGDDGSELVTEYRRDSVSRLLVKTLPDSEEIHYSYDAHGNLVNVDDGNCPSPTSTTCKTASSPNTKAGARYVTSTTRSAN